MIQTVVRVREKPEKELAGSSFFHESNSQLKVRLEPLLQRLTLGKSSTIFTYGCTGSGKTFTITGLLAEFESGLLTLCENFSIVELYSEKLTDLTGRSKTKLVVQSIKNGFAVSGLAEIPIADWKKVYTKAIANRVIAKTELNERSSRSHCLFVFRSANGGRLTFVDLAGSERVSESGVSGQNLKEAQSINKSLFFLSQVITELATGSLPSFRSSLLTQILKSSLSTGQTVLIACVRDLESTESLRTIDFANRCSKVVLVEEPEKEVEKGVNTVEIDRLREVARKQADLLEKISKVLEKISQ
jgi:hypothetical protein